MKKFLILSLMLGTVIFVVPTANAATTAAASAVADSQIRVQIGNNRRARTRIYTRIVRSGRNRYRETVRVTYRPNGRTRTQVLSRVRIGRNW